MKMSPALFAELKSDFNVIREWYVNTHGEHAFKCEIVNAKNTKGVLWDIFNRIQYDRMNDDAHPAFKLGRKRLLPFWSRNGESRDMQGNDHWLNRFYVSEDLNDSHIETALKAIHKEWKGA